MTHPGEETPADPYIDRYYFPHQNDTPGKTLGREEAFSEAFARYFGGDVTLKRDWPHMYEYFRSKFPSYAPEAPGRAYDPDNP